MFCFLSLASCLYWLVLVDHVTSSMVVYRDLIGYDIKLKSSASYLNKFIASRRMNCFTACSNDLKCQLVTYQSNTCRLYSISSLLALVPSSGITVSQKMINNAFGSIKVVNNTDQSLTNYWPIDGGDSSDVIGGNDLTSPNPTWSVDRYGQSTGAALVTDSTNYMQIMTGIYINPDFTIALWIKPYVCNQYSKIIDFDSGSMVDPLMIFLSSSCTITFYTKYSQISSSQSLSLNAWSFLVLTAAGNTFNIYFNGFNQVSSTSSPISSVIRTQCYFGKSQKSSDPYINAVYDDIKIYNRSMTAAEVVQLYNSQSIISYL